MSYRMKNADEHENVIVRICEEKIVKTKDFDEFFEVALGFWAKIRSGALRHEKYKGLGRKKLLKEHELLCIQSIFIIEGFMNFLEIEGYIERKTEKSEDGALLN